MVKKNPKLQPLSVTEIILRGEADIIREALEARVKIDSLLEEREAAYLRIAELESQVEEIVGDDAVFPFPAPPEAVAEFDTKAPAKKKKVAPKPSNSSPIGSSTSSASPEKKMTVDSVPSTGEAKLTPSDSKSQPSEFPETEPDEDKPEEDQDKDKTSS